MVDAVRSTGINESIQFDEIMLTNKKLLKINDNEISDMLDEYLKHINSQREKFQVQFENREKHYRKINDKNKKINF